MYRMCKRVHCEHSNSLPTRRKRWCSGMLHFEKDWSRFLAALPFLTCLAAVQAAQWHAFLSKLMQSSEPPLKMTRTTTNLTFRTLSSPELPTSVTTSHRQRQVRVLQSTGTRVYAEQSGPRVEFTMQCTECRTESAEYRVHRVQCCECTACRVQNTWHGVEWSQSTEYREQSKVHSAQSAQCGVQREQSTECIECSREITQYKVQSAQRAEL